MRISHLLLLSLVAHVQLALGVSFHGGAENVLDSTVLAKSKQLRIAHCFTGGMRTFNQPESYQTIVQNLTNHGDIFLSLYSGFENSLRASVNRMSPEELEDTLNFVKPKGLKLHSIDSDGLKLMWTMWEDCATMIEEHEKKMGFRYDLIFRGRPDHMYRCAPEHLQMVAEKHNLLRDKSKILTMEDQIHFFNREVLGIYHGVAESLAKVNMSTVCPKHGPVLGGSYCIQFVAFKKHDLTAFETKGSEDVCHPDLNRCEEGPGSFNSNIVSLVRDYGYIDAFDETFKNPDADRVYGAFKKRMDQIMDSADDSDFPPLSTARSCEIDSKYSYHCRNCVAHVINRIPENEVQQLLKNKFPACEDVSVKTLIKEASKGGFRFSIKAAQSTSFAIKKWFCVNFPKHFMCEDLTKKFLETDGGIECAFSGKGCEKAGLGS